jgi:hypothetical protein
MTSEGKIEATAILIINKSALGWPSNCRIPLAPHWLIRPHFRSSAHA